MSHIRQGNDEYYFGDYASRQTDYTPAVEDEQAVAGVESILLFLEEK